ncbi:MAG: MBL fold metallo-hydrolase [Alphaproteobacteria bacterium]|nr:MBL fold metallo-hydrolase [Alphaproteobacteria bacterium]
MKRLLLAVVVLLVAGLGALAWTFSASDLPVPERAPVAAPAPMTTQGVALKAILAGKMLSRAGLAYRGGSMSEERVFNMGGILIQHPKGTLLFDTGFGKNVDEHFKTTPWLMQNTARYEKEPTVAEQLKALNIVPNGIVLTHAHWDHVSGLEDLPNIPVFVTKAELDFVNSGDPATLLARKIGTIAYNVYAFPDGPYMGFDKSFDLYADGSVVVVPAPGHTPGSIFVFITTSDAKRYLLIGDTAWQSEGYERPAEKPWLARDLVDNDAEEVRGLLVRMHQLKTQFPDLTIVPAHDRRIWETLPQLTASSPPQ